MRSARRARLSLWRFGVWQCYLALSLSVWGTSLEAHRVYRCEHEASITFQDKACRPPEVQTALIDFDFSTDPKSSAQSSIEATCQREGASQQQIDRRFDKKMKALRNFQENQVTLRQSPALSDPERQYLMREQMRLQAQLDHYR